MEDPGHHRLQLQSAESHPLQHITGTVVRLELRKGARLGWACQAGRVGKEVGHQLLSTSMVKEA